MLGRMGARRIAAMALGGAILTAPAVHAGLAQSAPARPAPAGAAPRAPVELGVRVAPDTVGIGQPFVVAVRVRAPRGATIDFPAGPDSGGAIEAIDPRVGTVHPDPSGTDVTAQYRLAAWDLGRQALTFGPVVVRVGGTERSIALGDLAVLVAPTAPADSASRTARPARPLFPAPAAWWWPWILGGAALIVVLLAWLVARWWRRRRRRLLVGAIDARALAEREFAALDRIGLLEAGEQGRYVALVVEVLRRYLARRLPAASTSLTSVELMDALRHDARVPVGRTRALLTETDLVKFARAPVSPGRARAIAAEARALVADVDVAARAAAAASAVAGGAPTAPPRRSAGRVRAA
jgi:uncharacterized protein DUF4381